MDQDYAIRTKPHWYDLLDHIICLSLTFSLRGGVQGCSCGSLPKVLAQDTRATNRSVLWLLRSRSGDRSIGFFRGIPLLVFNHNLELRIWFTHNVTLLFVSRECKTLSNPIFSVFSNDCVKKNPISTVRGPATARNTATFCYFSQNFLSYRILRELSLIVKSAHKNTSVSLSFYAIGANIPPSPSRLESLFLKKRDHLICVRLSIQIVD